MKFCKRSMNSNRAVDLQIMHKYFNAKIFEKISRAVLTVPMHSE